MSQRRNWIPITWTICLIIVSLQPLRSDAIGRHSLAHLPLHTVLYGVTALLLLRWIPQPTLFGIVRSTFLLATGIELTQHLLYKGSFEWMDLLADAVGVALAILWQAYNRRASFGDRL